MKYSKEPMTLEKFIHSNKCKLKMFLYKQWTKKLKKMFKET